VRITFPREGEPIRLVSTAAGHRYRVVLDVAPKSARRKQVTRTFDTLQKARAFVNETRDRLAKGRYLAPSAVTVRALADEWLANRRDIREISVRGYRCVLEPVLRRLGAQPVQSITRADVEALVAWMETDGGQHGQGLSQRSIVYAVGALRQVFAYGLTTSALASNPVEHVKARRRRKGDRRESTVWESSELMAFRAVADTDELAAAWRLSLCGGRRSEVLGLSWKAVDLDAGIVRIEAGRVALSGGRTALDDAKSEASYRDVPVEAMHAGTTAMLKALKAQQAADKLRAGTAYDESGLVVVDALGRGIHPDAYSARFRALCKVAEVPRIRLHEIRHTVALTVHRAGVAPADAASLLGHTLATHLQFYVPRTKQGADHAADALGQALAAVR
jgi:integrase